MVVAGHGALVRRAIAREETQMPNELMTPLQAALLLGLAERTVRQHVHENDWPVETINGRMMIRPEVLVIRYGKDLTHPILRDTTIERLHYNAQRAEYPLDIAELEERSREYLRQHRGHVNQGENSVLGGDA
jgi:hypothetical protein